MMEESGCFDDFKHVSALFTVGLFLLKFFKSTLKIIGYLTSMFIENLM